ncbi:MAG: hypothetical protein LV481_04645 [Methylacidiphilales bacterium]|nr:hypothetical protein [Candidatus Methylacidiphilales bacterium]
MKKHLKTKAARNGLILLDRMRDRFRDMKDRVPVHREVEWQSCMEMLESLSNAILDDEDLSDEVAMQRLVIPELFLLSLSTDAREEEA